MKSLSNQRDRVPKGFSRMLMKDRDAINNPKPIQGPTLSQCLRYLLSLPGGDAFKALQELVLVFGQSIKVGANNRARVLMKGLRKLVGMKRRRLEMSPSPHSGLWLLIEAFLLNES